MTGILAFALGLVVGSFSNVCIQRWPRGQSVVTPRSRCPECSTPIAWHDNIPVLSFAVLGGRCRACERAIPVRYPIVELATGALYWLIAAQYGVGAEAAKLAVFAPMMVILFFTDLKHLILPNQVTLTGILVGIGFSLLVPLRPGLAGLGYQLLGYAPSPQVVSVSEAVLGSALFAGILVLLAEAFYRMQGVTGLGLGDIKLVAALVTFHGTYLTLLVLLLACLLATIVGVAGVMVGAKGWRDPLPLGSYISAVALASIFLSDTMLGGYWELVLR